MVTGKKDSQSQILQEKTIKRKKQRKICINKLTRAGKRDRIKALYAQKRFRLLLCMAQTAGGDKR